MPHVGASTATARSARRYASSAATGMPSPATLRAGRSLAAWLSRALDRCSRRGELARRAAEPLLHVDRSRSRPAPRAARGPARVPRPRARDRAQRRAGLAGELHPPAEVEHVRRRQHREQAVARALVRRGRNAVDERLRRSQRRLGLLLDRGQLTATVRSALRPARRAGAARPGARRAGSAPRRAPRRRRRPGPGRSGTPSSRASMPGITEPAPGGTTATGRRRGCGAGPRAVAPRSRAATGHRGDARARRRAVIDPSRRSPAPLRLRPPDPPEDRPFCPIRGVRNPRTGRAPPLGSEPWSASIPTATSTTKTPIRRTGGSGTRRPRTSTPSGASGRFRAMTTSGPPSTTGLRSRPPGASPLSGGPKTSSRCSSRWTRPATPSCGPWSAGRSPPAGSPSSRSRSGSSPASSRTASRPAPGST